MTKKILLAGLFGGILMFLWEGLAHEVLPLGTAGLSALDNEAGVVANLKENVKQSGFYIFPGGEMLKGGLTAEQKEAAAKKYAAGPSGIMIVHPEGGVLDSPRPMIIQVVLDIVLMMLCGFVISRLPDSASYGRRLCIMGVMGLFPTLNAELPYWNWFGFPTVYVMAQACVHLMAFVIGGLVVAKLVKPAPPEPKIASRVAA